MDDYIRELTTEKQKAELLLRLLESGQMKIYVEDKDIVLEVNEELSEEQMDAIEYLVKKFVKDTVSEIDGMLERDFEL